MAQHEDHFTVFIRLPFPRGDFVDPPPVAWSAAKERGLWEILSRQSKGNEIDWKTLSEKFQVTQSFLLQQAAWLYERQLSQVRAQMRRMGNRSSNTASPVSGSSAGSMVGEQSVKKTVIGGSRAPSRLSTQMIPNPQPEGSTPPTPVRSRTSLPHRTSSGGIVSHARISSTSSRPLSRQSSKDDTPSRIHSRRSSVQHQLSRSPAQVGLLELDSSSDEDVTQSKLLHRRPNPSASRRAVSTRKSQQTRPVATHVEEDDDDDTPAFLPFSNTGTSLKEGTTSSHDPSATLKGYLPSARRPSTNRRATSERIITTTAQQSRIPQMTSSNSSTSATEDQSAFRSAHDRQPASQARPSSERQGSLPNPLSPRQQAALAAAAGLSPRRRSVNPQQAGSDTSPSMGSSFSDLDDVSVTQSALEEALMSGMGNTTMTVGGGAGGVASRVSGISQALRSRYFDARGGTTGGGGGGESQK